MYHNGMYRKKNKGTKKSLYEKSYRELVPMLDKEYSLYRRMSSAISSYTPGYVRCCTCGEIKHWNDIDLGHYITRAVMETRYDDRNTAPQCRKCNRFMNGRADLMREYLVKTYGIKEVEDIELKAKLGNPWTAETLLEKIVEYRKLNSGLRKIL